MEIMAKGRKGLSGIVRRGGLLFFLLCLTVVLDVNAQAFAEKEVVITGVDKVGHDTMQLAGTLTYPTGVSGKVPAVILITGSGAQNRDGNYGTQAIQGDCRIFVGTGICRAVVRR